MTSWLNHLDKLEPFCRVVGHTSEEVREILAVLETVYREPFPHLNLRQWSGAIYMWLTQPVLDPTSSGRVTMDLSDETRHHRPGMEPSGRGNRAM